MLELKHLCFEAETDDGVRQILKDVSLTVDERMVVITGPNGSGKSTMAKLIAGIEQPTSGQILLDGEDITHMSITERARRGEPLHASDERHGDKARGGAGGKRCHADGPERRGGHGDARSREHVARGVGDLLAHGHVSRDAVGERVQAGLAAMAAARSLDRAGLDAAEPPEAHEGQQAGDRRGAQRQRDAAQDFDVHGASNLSGA